MSHKGALRATAKTITDPQTGIQTKQYLAFAQKLSHLMQTGSSRHAEKIREITGPKRVPIPGVVLVSSRRGTKGFTIPIRREIVQAQNPAEGEACKNKI